MSSAPPTWTEVRLGEIADTQLGKMLSEKARTGVGSRRYLRNKNVQWGRFDLNDVSEMDFTQAEFEKFAIAPGDLLVCEGGEVGRAAIWRGQVGEFAFQKALHRIRPRAGVIPEWLLYLLMRLGVTNGFDPFVTGSTIKHLPQEDLRQLPVSLPPVEEQRRIVGLIEEQFSRLDATHGLLLRARTGVKALRRAAFSLAVASGDKRDVGELLERIEAGRSFRCHGRPANTDEWGVIKVSAMTWGSFDQSENKAVVSAESVDSRWEIKPGDVLLSRANTSEYVGASVLVDHCRSGLLLSDKSMRLIPCLDVVDRRWLQFALSAPESRTQISAIASGTSDSMRNISQAKVMSVSLHVPPLSEQPQIVAEIERRLSVTDAMARAIEVARGRSAALRRSILDAAFTGSLASQDRPLGEA